MTINRSQKFENTIGNFEYITMNGKYYSVGIKQQTIDNQYTFLIATPEKALCDIITATPRLKIQSVKALREYLEEDLRFDISSLETMNQNTIKECVENATKKKNVLKLLLKLLQQ